MTTPPNNAAHAADRARQALARLQARLAELEARTSAPIAIVGMACRLPGGVRDPEGYWSLLGRGEDAITPIPRERWDADAYFDADPQAPGRTYVRHGGFVDDIDRFDAGLFDISPREAAELDPQQRMLLEETWAALEDSGDLNARLAGSRTGVFVGLATNDYALRHIASPDPARIDVHSLTGAAGCIASGRIAYVLGLEGPAITVDTACSSSLLAVHLACQSLREGACDLAVAGGANALLAPALSIYLCRARALSPSGRCRAFDAGADGFVRSEGCAMIVLRRLDDALARGDRIYAVIRGSAVNNDGKSNGLTAPNGAAQRRLLADALRAARVGADDIGYVEAHGTGTPLGDPIEYGALADVLGRRQEPVPPLLVGSVKTNLGHLEAAAGIAGLIKLVLCIERGVVPAQLHFAARNPYLGAEEARIDIATQQQPWPSGYARRIGGVSSFGFSGTNVHMIVEEAPARAAVPAMASSAPSLLMLSARSESALRALAARYAERVAAADAPPLHDLCGSANSGRLALGVRTALVAGTHAELALGLAHVADGTRAVTTAGRPRLGFLYTGQGASHPGMARALAEASPLFRDALARLDAALVGLGEASLLPRLLGDDREGAEAAQPARRAQPMMFMLQAALTELWRAWGVTPDAVLGHSLGEYAAACAAGVLAPDDALALVLERARLMDELPARGAMWAASAPAVRLEALLAAHPGVAVAVHNGPDDFVIAGADEALAPALAALGAADARLRRLEVTHAFHSPVMDPVLARFEAAVAAVGARGGLRPARLPVYSTLHGAVAAAEAPAAPRYWRDHLRQPVRFDAALRALLADGADVLVEIGPAPLLRALGRRIAGEGDERAWLASLTKDQGIETMLASLGALYERGFPVDAEAWARERGRFVRVAVPGYPFERRRHWLEPAPATGAARPWFALERLDSPAVAGAVLASELDLAALPLVADHIIRGEPLVNLVVYLALVGEAYHAATGRPARQLDDVFIGQPLALGDGERHQVQVLLDVDGAAGDGAVGFRVVSRRADAAPGSAWLLHAAGSVGPGIDDARPAVAPFNAGRAADLDAFYDTLAGRGIALGPACRGLGALAYDASDAAAAIGELRAPAASRGEPGAFPLALIDGAFQSTMLPALTDATARIIVGFDRLRLYGEWRAATHARGEQRLGSDGGASARFVAVDAAGQVVAVCEGIRLQPLRPRGDGEAAARPAHPAAPTRPRSPERHAGLRTTLLAATSGERAALAERALVEVLAEVLRLDAAEVAGRRPEPLTRLGVDSFLAMELAERVARMTGVRVSLLSILQDATVTSLAAELVRKLGAPAPAADDSAMEEGAL